MYYEKNNLTIVIALISNLTIKAQNTMIVHGTNATKFYLYQNGVTYSMFADELWWGTDNEGTGIINATNFVLNPTQAFEIPNLNPPPVIPSQDYTLSCQSAQGTYGSGNVNCGPFIAANTRPYCKNINSLACSIIIDNTIYVSAAGEFSQWGIY